MYVHKLNVHTTTKIIACKVSSMGYGHRWPNTINPIMARQLCIMLVKYVTWHTVHNCRYNSVSCTFRPEHLCQHTACLLISWQTLLGWKSCQWITYINSCVLLVKWLLPLSTNATMNLYSIVHYASCGYSVLKFVKVCKLCALFTFGCGNTPTLMNDGNNFGIWDHGFTKVMDMKYVCVWLL